MKHLSTGLAVIAALVLFQTLFFKFSGASESIFIFNTLGVEPFGRYASGVMELIAGVLLLMPRTRAVGAVMSLGIISGAILSHLFVLGIEIQGDGGLLFGLALVVFIASSAIIYLEKVTLFHIYNKMLRKI